MSPPSLQHPTPLSQGCGSSLQWLEIFIELGVSTFEWLPVNKVFNWGDVSGCAVVLHV